MNIDQTEQELKRIIAGELKHFKNYFLFDEMRQLDLGCFPWNGNLEISFLTAKEPGLKKDSDIAAWRLYNFTQSYGSTWPAVKEIGRWMQKECAEKRLTLEDLLKSCAKVLTSKEVMSALKENYKLANDFKVTVYDPDNPKKGNFCEVK